MGIILCRKIAGDLVAFVHHPFCWRSKNGFSVCEQLIWLCSILFQCQCLCRVSFLSCQHVPSPGHRKWHNFIGICSHLLWYDSVFLTLILSYLKILYAFLRFHMLLLFLSLVLYPIVFWKLYSQARFKTHRVDHMNADRWLLGLMGGLLGTCPHHSAFPCFCVLSPWRSYFFLQNLPQVPSLTPGHQSFLECTGYLLKSASFWWD